MKKTLKILIKTAGTLLCAMLFAVNAVPGMDTVAELPKHIYVDDAGGAEKLASLPEPFTVTDRDGVAVTSDLSERLGQAQNGEVKRFSIELFGVTVKNIDVHVRDDIYVMPCGSSVGISLWCNGVLVVGLGNVDDGQRRRCPAQEAGIRTGDSIIAVNGTAVEGINHLSTLTNSAGDSMELTVKRNNTQFVCTVYPCIKNGEAILGAWVRESTAGIGTLAFYTMSWMNFGALGHAVTDPDAGAIIDAKKGELVDATIVGVTHGEQGFPGEVRGTFSALSKKLGTVYANTRYGVFGTMHAQMPNELYPEGVKLAYPDEVELGPATLLTSLDDGSVTEYSCEIIKLFEQSASDGKGMVVKVTDERLLERTGGIVQGMSGSPILQNGKLIGAVTHVFINDPTRGYGIYAYWMYEQMR